MSEPFLAEIRMVGFNFAPRGWAFCDGQLLPINQNQALFSLMGTFYGGDGRTTFALPDLRGRVPIHFDNVNPLGDRGGQEIHTLTVTEMPAHVHGVETLTADATSPVPSHNHLARASEEIYAPPDNLAPLHAGAVGSTGANQPHDNMQPFLTVSFCIALQGLYPSRN